MFRGKEPKYKNKEHIQNPINLKLIKLQVHRRKNMFYKYLILKLFGTKYVII